MLPKIALYRLSQNQILTGFVRHRQRDWFCNTFRLRERDNSGVLKIVAKTGGFRDGELSWMLRRTVPTNGCLPHRAICTTIYICYYIYMTTLTKPLMTRPEFDAALQDFSGELFSLASLDIDHFKEVNDTYGYAAGDAVLRDLEAVLLGSLPQEATVARLGGDEYVVLLSDMPAESTLIVMEEVRRHFSSRTVPGVPFRLQLSVGIASHPTHAAKDGLLSAANEALHRAKVEGRGRVAIFVESKMTLKSNYYSKASLERLTKLSSALNRTEASLLREALDDLFIKHSGAL